MKAVTSCIQIITLTLASPTHKPNEVFSSFSGFNKARQHSELLHGALNMRFYPVSPYQQVLDTSKISLSIIFQSKSGSNITIFAITQDNTYISPEMIQLLFMYFKSACV